VIEAGDIGGKSSLKRLFESAPHAAAIACYRDEAAALPALITQHLKAAGLEIDRDAVSYLAANLGGDRGITRAELDKLVLYMGDEKKVSLEDAMANVGDQSAVGQDDLCTAIGLGDLRGLERQIERNLAESNEISLIRAVVRHFMKLHQGISTVPPKLLKFGNQALRYWAEKWSSLFGEWVYDDLFGYVWRPADEQFAFTRRPFFDATYTHINGQLFLVPQQLWGWVPAHMGTWVWMTRGWTWIPGDWFHNGVVDDFHGLYTFPTFNYYWDVYRSDGGLGLVPRPGRKDKLPGPMLQIVKKVLKAPDDNQIKREAIRQTVPEIDAKILPPGRPPVPAEAGKPGPLTRPMVKSNGTIHLPDDAGLPRERDWNPDSQVAARNGGRIRYSISGNAVVCPELKRFSRGFDIRQSSLGESGSGQGNGAYAGGTTSSPQPPPPGGANNNSGSDKVGPDGGAKTDKD